ncbi:hypothetical protein M2475_002069 [Breznakia sp. PF5-3]|uniref:hypothetical protein n=1 Tax=unclassified Breznakia TaxID=2623764 RepID=UPI002405D4AE|nr:MULTISPECIES: hypothetical protein [unclassified Breznakia]MDF9825650.1 hypothetical protein [Breznakia sp. PM6-1]MDF9836488.1 hypothetical protein [Breznakia sp. PF5-3]MDF9838667.1 hypothetical protein [Breznakia sp. PFB2-8]MDF9860708.1 hypothetical protein [Breznakia sp. PH5-24]
MRKITIVFMTSLLFFLASCGGNKDDEVKKTEIKIDKNEVYTPPKNPTDYQAETYNALTKALKKNNEEAVAKLVAENFTADFFTLKNKESAEDVGGLTYFPATRQEEFKTFAMNYVYSNYQLIKDDYGKSSLPVVEEVKVGNVSKETITYKNIIPSEDENVEDQVEENEYEGYVINITISYESTDVPDKDLKKEAVIYVIKLDERLVIIKLD